jgi:hypothetical protein
MTRSTRRNWGTLVLVFALLTACSSAGGEASTPVSEPPTTTQDQAAPTTTTPVLEAPEPYVPAAGEPSPEVKQAAAQVVQALLTYPVGGGTLQQAAIRIEGLPAAPGVAAQAGPLLRPNAAATAEIVYPQYGGLLEDAASVMVITRYRVRTAERDDTVVRTIDVRLARQADAWQVTELASLGGNRPADSPLSGEGAAVLANPAIELPASARWDIKAGRVDPRILQLLLTIARDHSMSVTTFSTGHPVEVFGTPSVSNHTEGRGVDIWAVDDRPVIDQRSPDSPLRDLVVDLVAQGVTELGSPWAVGGGSFTNTLHQDHLHLAYDS